MTPVMERFYLNLKILHELLKIECVLWKWDVGVCLDRECAEFVTAG